MANIKTTQEEWELCREYFEAGVSLSKITAKTGISKTQISKRSNAENWAKGTHEKEQLIADAVRVVVAKGTLTEQALAVHNELVNESPLIAISKNLSDAGIAGTRTAKRISEAAARHAAKLPDAELLDEASLKTQMLSATVVNATGKTGLDLLTLATKPKPAEVNINVSIADAIRSARVSS
jgi:hypothetical protein